MSEPKPIQSEYGAAHIDLTAAISAFKEGLFKGFEVCIPACIYSYDPTTHRASVLPLVKGGFFDGKKWTYEARNIIKDVSVWQLNCGGINIEFPLYVGDTGWLIASDRNTEYLKQDGALTASTLEGDRNLNFLETEYPQEPANHGMHLLTNGFFLPDNWGRRESYRYKDSPTQSIANTIYIGTNFDTDEGGVDETDGKQQYGRRYERKTSSSLVVVPYGPISMNSSAALEESDGSNAGAKKKERGSSSVQASESIASLASLEEIREGGNDAPFILNREATVKSDYENGIVLQHINPQKKQVGTVRATSDSISLTVHSGKNYATLGLKDGRLFLSLSGDVDISADGDINLKAGGQNNVSVNGDANVNIGGMANVAATNGVNVVSGGDINVNAANTVNVSSAEGVIVNTEKDITVTAKENITVKTKQDVNVEAGGNVAVTANGQMNLTAGATMTLTAPDIRLESGALRFLEHNIHIEGDSGCVKGDK